MRISDWSSDVCSSDLFLAAGRTICYNDSMAEIDPHTLRVAASLVRSRIAGLTRDTRMDGLQRLGAHRTLTQLAIDLEVSADHALGNAPCRERRCKYGKIPGVWR